MPHAPTNSSRTTGPSISDNITLPLKWVEDAEKEEDVKEIEKDDENGETEEIRDKKDTEEGENEEIEKEWDYFKCSEWSQKEHDGNNYLSPE